MDDWGTRDSRCPGIGLVPTREEDECEGVRCMLPKGHVGRCKAWPDGFDRPSLRWWRGHMESVMHG